MVVKFDRSLGAACRKQVALDGLGTGFSQKNAMNSNFAFPQI
jgi:hypothetical protein